MGPPVVLMIDTSVWLDLAKDYSQRSLLSALEELVRMGQISLLKRTKLAEVRRVFETGSYSDIYGWLQFVLGRHRPREFAERIATILKYCRSPYRIVADDVICPIGTDEEAATVNKAFVDLRAFGLSGAREHLKAASGELSAGNFADSVRESIHAVESAVRVLEPSGDFSKALDGLPASGSTRAKAGHFTYPLVSKRLSGHLLCAMLLIGTFRT
jgi:hypothetical protein